MPGLCQSNDFISRDEGLHTEFACSLLKQLINLPTSSVVNGIVSEALTIEMEFGKGVLPMPCTPVFWGSLLAIWDDMTNFFEQTNADYRSPLVTDDDVVLGILFCTIVGVMRGNPQSSSQTVRKVESVLVLRRRKSAEAGIDASQRYLPESWLSQRSDGRAYVEGEEKDVAHRLGGSGGYRREGSYTEGNSGGVSWRAAAAMVAENLADCCDPVHCRAIGRGWLPSFVLAIVRSVTLACIAGTGLGSNATYRVGLEGSAACWDCRRGYRESVPTVLISNRARPGDPETSELKRPASTETRSWSAGAKLEARIQARRCLDYLAPFSTIHPHQRGTPSSQKQLEKVTPELPHLPITNREGATEPANVNDDDESTEITDTLGSIRVILGATPLRPHGLDHNSMAGDVGRVARAVGWRGPTVWGKRQGEPRRTRWRFKTRPTFDIEVIEDQHTKVGHPRYEGGYTAALRASVYGIVGHSTVEVGQKYHITSAKKARAFERMTQGRPQAGINRTSNSASSQAEMPGMGAVFLMGEGSE
ncbi:hypothetical protein FA13DRAFT_1712383 [Coprinellus micaceus]|uniref:Uncharacterized protein n=1 Tax=Coprinellus micaceus TaxID=71717 RepID=A0A4Y7T0J4_COPMI|nr:hypothetical protein FA13DRAFT_1712383 [Coprinellus micaceus]